MKPLLRCWIKILVISFLMIEGTGQAFATSEKNVQGIPIRFRMGEDASSIDHGGKFVTFGHVFPVGFLKKGESIALSLDGKTYPLQVDIKAYHDDKSIRHAILTILLPDSLPAGFDLKGVLLPVSHAISEPSLDFDSLADSLLNKGYNLRLETTLKNIQGITLAVDIVKLLKTKKFSPYDKKAWLEGPYVVERRLSMPLAKGITVDADIRLYANGTARTDVQFRYDWLKQTPMKGALQYGVSLKEGGKSLFSQALVRQHPHTKWHDVVWWGGTSNVYVAFDPLNLLRAGAIPAYDFGLKISDTSIAGDYSNFEKSDTRLMASGLINPGMPTSGGRDDLGLLPQWTAKYVLSMDPRMHDIVLTHADLAGGIPWHYRDEKTGQAPQAVHHPRIWIDDRATVENNGIEPAVLDRDNTIWIPDSAHQPSLSFIPYVITGDRYYLESLQAQAQWNALSTDPNYSRPNGDDIPTPIMFHQVREFAWNMRTFGEVAWITPDDDILKPVFIKTLDKALDWFTYMQINGANNKQQTGEITGFLEGYAGDNLNPTFMQDFCAQAFSGLVQKGFTGWRSLVKWQLNFVAARFLQRYNGFPPEDATAFKFDQWDYNAPNGVETLGSVKKAYRKTWGSVHKATGKAGLFQMERGTNEVIPGYTGLADGFAGYARAAVASLWNQTFDPRALEAYGFLAQYTEAMNEKYSSVPTFAITPRFFDGRGLRIADIKVGSAGDNNLKAEHPYMLLVGGLGDDTLDGGDGPAFLLGGQGSDLIYAGSRGSILISGEGNDRLISGAGDDIMLSGNEPRTSTTFIYDTLIFGKDRIYGFRPRRDKIVLISRNRGGLKQGVDHYFDITLGSYEKLEDDYGNGIASHIRTETDGSAVIDCGDAGQITLVGVNPSQLGTDTLIMKKMGSAD